MRMASSLEDRDASSSFAERPQPVLCRLSEAHTSRMRVASIARIAAVRAMPDRKISVSAASTRTLSPLSPKGGEGSAPLARGEGKSKKKFSLLQGEGEGEDGVNAPR